MATVLELTTVVQPEVLEAQGHAGRTTGCCCCFCECGNFCRPLCNKLRQCCLFKFIYQSWWFKVRLFLVLCLVVPFDVYKDWRVALKYQVTTNEYEERFEYMRSDINAYQSEDNSLYMTNEADPTGFSVWDYESSYGASMREGWFSLAPEEQDELCNIPLLFDQVNNLRKSHSNLDEMHWVNGAMWCFFAISVIAMVMYFTVLFCTGTCKFLCCDRIKMQAVEGDVVRNPCCCAVHVATTEEEKAAWEHFNAYHWDKSQLPWYLAFMGMMVQLFEDMPQMCLLIWNVNSLYREDGHACLQKLRDWGENPLYFNDGGREMMTPLLSWNDVTFLDFFAQRSEIMVSLGWSTFVILYTYWLTMAKAQSTVPIEPVGGDPSHGVGHSLCCHNGCTQSVFCCCCGYPCPFFEYMAITTLFALIITPIFANFYWGGVVEFGLEDTFGGSFILFGFVTCCLTVVGLFFFWFCYFFCTKTKQHFKDDEIDAKRKEHLKKMNKWSDKLNGIKVIKNMKDRVHDPANKLSKQMQKFQQRGQQPQPSQMNGQQPRELSVQSNVSMTDQTANGHHVINMMKGQNTLSATAVQPSFVNPLVQYGNPQLQQCGNPQPPQQYGNQTKGGQNGPTLNVTSQQTQQQPDNVFSEVITRQSGHIDDESNEMYFE